MKVADAIKNLSELNPDEEIMIQWFTKEHAEYMEEDNPLPQEQWDMAVRIFDKNSQIIRRHSIAIRCRKMDIIIF